MAYFHDSVTFGEPVYFIDGDKKKTIVDETGHFVHFPGVIHGRWENQITVSVDLENPSIRFRTSFETNGDGYRCYWELQPDGRYWGDDDGFGADNASELILCADMDKNGDFVTPFRINNSKTLAKFVKTAKTFDSEFNKLLKKVSADKNNAVQKVIHEYENLDFKNLHSQWIIALGPNSDLSKTDQALSSCEDYCKKLQSLTQLLHS